MTDTPFLLVDVETSGLDPHHSFSRPLELGLALVTPDLAIVDRYSWVIPYRPADVDVLREHASYRVQEMHDASGLWDACRDPAGFFAVDGSAGIRHSPLHADITTWVHEHAPDVSVPLLGSSIHFDARWLVAWLPGVLTGPMGEPRTHRLADVSAMRELLARWAPAIVDTAPGPRRLHRVDPDMDDTLAEARHYRDALGLTPHPTE